MKFRLDDILKAMQKHLGLMKTIYHQCFDGDRARYFELTFDEFFNEVFLSISNGKSFSEKGAWLGKACRNVAGTIKTKASRKIRDRSSTKTIHFEDGDYDIEASGLQPIDFLYLHEMNHFIERFRQTINAKLNICLDICIEGLTGKPASDEYLRRVSEFVSSSGAKLQIPKTYYAYYGAVKLLRCKFKEFLDKNVDFLEYGLKFI